MNGELPGWFQKEFKEMARTVHRLEAIIQAMQPMCAKRMERMERDIGKAHGRLDAHVAEMGGREVHTAMQHGELKGKMLLIVGVLSCACAGVISVLVGLILWKIAGGSVPGP